MPDSKHPPTVYTIPPDRPFADSLAAGLLDRSGGDPMGLSRALVLVPTRRACRTLRDAFLRQSDGNPLLLPRLQPIGDVDEDELVFQADDEPASAAALDLPPAIPEIRRRLMLARLILSRAERTGEILRADQAAWLAAELARLLDQVQTEGLSFDGLADIVPEADMARHWQETVRFLDIVTDAWPGVLAEQGMVDPAVRRNALLSAQADAWRSHPPDFPVFAAGSTGSIPATAELLGVVATLPKGAVVLPGLDRDWLDERAWAVLPPSHPQYGMARLLERLGVDRMDVPDWPAWLASPGAEPPVSRARARLVAEALRPAESLPDAREPALDRDATFDAMRGVSYVRAPGVREEAAAIALMLREALERDQQPGERPRTAALVTPDRDLARRVTAELRRWGITIDDSAGQPLDATPPATFLRLIAQTVNERLAPVPLISLLKHPFTSCGGRPAETRAEARFLERYLLRGPRPGAGIDGLRNSVAALDLRNEARTTESRRRLDAFLERLEGALKPLMDCMGDGPSRVPDLLRAHIQCAEALAADESEPGAARLWAGEDGEALAGFMESLFEATDGFPAIHGSQYPALLNALMTGEVVRPRYGTHPRLAILGPLEARLVQPDLVIVGGMNEGTWPRDVPADPWMSRPMRAAFGLPDLERRIGLAAHDFQQAFCAPRVVLTRASKAEGTPTVPSRWLLRLETVLRGAGAIGENSEGAVAWPENQWVRWADRLNDPGGTHPVDRPAPTPPLAARPRKLSVTEIGTLMQDPYAIYARHVLKLAALDPLDADPGAAERGSFIHDALEKFIAAGPDFMSETALQQLVACGKDAFGDTLARPAVWAFWWPRFLAIARWIIAHEAERADVVVRTPERRGAFVLNGPGGAFTLSCRADRLDRLADGTLAIIDYKTGGVPRKIEIEAGVAPQLALEAVVAAAGGFEDMPEAETSRLLYWQLRGSREPGNEITIKSAAERIEDARAGLESLIAAFDDASTPYLAVPRERFAPAFNDYALLERIGEWSPGGPEPA